MHNSNHWYAYRHNVEVLKFLWATNIVLLKILLIFAQLVTLV